MKWALYSFQLVAALFLLMSGTGPNAQQLLQGEDLTADNLIEALTPEFEARTRSVRIQRDAMRTPSSREPRRVAGEKRGASLLITFVTNSAKLTPDARSKLDVVAVALQAERLADFKFAVEGHADPRGKREYNFRLSQARAESAVDYLVARHRIERDRLKPIGKGDTELINMAWPEAPENRRITIVTIVD